MAGFQFTPDGIIPLEKGDDAPISHAADFSPGVVRRHEPTRATPAAQQTRILLRAPELTGKNVVKLARERVRALDREIKRLRSLELERDELKRLLAAAEKPSAKPKPVTRIGVA